MSMHFGITNAPATFQRALDIFMNRFEWWTCLVYVDEIIIFSDNWVDPLLHVSDVMTVLRNA